MLFMVMVRLIKSAAVCCVAITCRLSGILMRCCVDCEAIASCLLATLAGLCWTVSPEQVFVSRKSEAEPARQCSRLQISLNVDTAVILTNKHTQDKRVIAKQYTVTL